MKKIIQRLLATALCAALLFSISVPAGAYGFTDVPSTYLYLDAVNYVSDNDIMTGTDTTTFAPNNALTRAMMVYLLYRKAGKPSVYGSNPFMDVSETAYYRDAVVWAVDQKITSGTSATTFSPNKTLTREQAMCFLYNYMKKTPVAVRDNFDNINGQERKEVTDILKKYSDQGTISSYARPAMAWAEKRGVLIITDPNKVKIYPQSYASRVQAAYGITAFGTNVEKLCNDADLLCFQNEGSSGVHFDDKIYYMTRNHIEKYKNKLHQKYGGGSPYDTALAKFESERVPSNGPDGRCFGMCAVTALDKYGKIEYNKNFGDSAETMFDVQCFSPSWAESAISYYHLSQYLTPIFPGRTTDVKSQLDALVNAKGLSLLSFCAAYPPDSNTSENYYHAVMVNSCQKIGSDYKLVVYDPNVAETSTWNLTSRSGFYYFPSTLSYLFHSEKYGMKTAYAMTNLDVFDFLDIDGYQNSVSNGVSPYSLSNSELSFMEETASETDIGETPWNNYPEDFSTVYFRLQDGVTITNDNSETLTWKNGELSGDMEVYGWNFIVGTSPALAYADVPLSKTFQMETPEGTLQEFSVVDRYRYQCIEDFSGTAELHGDGTIDLEGSLKEFTATCFLPKTGIQQTLSGTGSQAVRLDFTGENATAEGLIGTYTLQKTAWEEEEPIKTFTTTGIAEEIN